MDTKLKEILFQLANSHSKLAQAEYNRNPAYNDTHFSHKAEIALINYLQEVGLERELYDFMNKAN